MAPRWDFIITCILHLILLTCTNAVRDFDRRNDLKIIPPVSESGWSVPLVGNSSCMPGSAGCYEALSRPGENKTLQVLAIGRGTFNYTCEDRLPANPPAFVSQYTELYNAAALVATLPNEESLHAIMPDFLDYDYAMLSNSSLECMGSIGTLDDLAVITLLDIDTFQVSPFENVYPPGNASVDGLWSHSVSGGGEWEVYRVEMVGGAIPVTCANQNVTIHVEYAAEYWFYS